MNNPSKPSDEEAKAQGEKLRQLYVKCWSEWILLGKLVDERASEQKPPRPPGDATKSG